MATVQQFESLLHPFTVLLSWLLGTWHLRRLAWSLVDHA